MYVCMYVYINACMYVCMLVYIHICRYVFMYLYIYVSVYVCVCISLGFFAFKPLRLFSFFRIFAPITPIMMKLTINV